MGYPHIDDRIKDAAIEAVRLNGMSQYEVAKKFGISQSALCRWLKKTKYDGVERKSMDALTDDQKEWLRRMPKSFKKMGDIVSHEENDEVTEFNNEMIQEILSVWPVDVDGYLLAPETDVKIFLANELDEPVQERFANEPVSLPPDVANPAHYTSGGIECIDAIRASMTNEGFIQYLRGNVMKYIWRYDKKGFAKKDLEKAIWYISKIISMLDD